MCGRGKIIASTIIQEIQKRVQLSLNIIMNKFVACLRLYDYSHCSMPYEMS